MIKRGEAEAAEASLACDCLLQQERNDTNKNRKSSIHKEQQLLDLPPDSFRKGQMYRMEGFMHACMDKKMLSEQFRNKYFYGGKHQRESEILRFLRRYFFPIRSSDPLLMAHEDCLIVAIVVWFSTDGFGGIAESAVSKSSDFYVKLIFLRKRIFFFSARKGKLSLMSEL